MVQHIQHTTASGRTLNLRSVLLTSDALSRVSNTGQWGDCSPSQQPRGAKMKILHGWSGSDPPPASAAATDTKAASQPQKDPGAVWSVSPYLVNKAQIDRATGWRRSSRLLGLDAFKDFRTCVCFKVFATLSSSSPLCGMRRDDGPLTGHVIPRRSAEDSSRRRKATGGVRIVATCST